MRDERAALLMGATAVLLWSTVATGFKLGLELMTPLQLLFVGACFSTAVFAAAAWRKGWPRRHFRLREGLAYGLVNPVLYYLVLLEAYARLPAQIAQPLNYTWAIMLALLAVPVLGQKLSLRMGLGIGIGYLGVLIVLSQGRFDAWPQLDPLGLLLALLSTLIWAGYWLGNAGSATEPEPFMASSFLLALPMLGVLCLLGPGLPAWRIETFAYGAWVGCIEMGFTFLLWQQALKRTRHAGRIGQLIFLAPFLSLIMIGSVLGEAIHPTSWIGLLVIVGGLVVTGRPDARPERASPAAGSVEP